MAIDKVFPLKQEDSDGSYYTESNPSEDYISIKGIAFENSDNHTIDTVSNELAFKDPITGQLSFSHLYDGNPITHRNRDQLVHHTAENSYVELIRTSGRITQIIEWTDSGKTLKIREQIISRSPVTGLTTQAISKQYTSTGNVVVETLTETVTRNSNGRIQNIDIILT